MHGIIYFLLNRFAENTLGENGWARLFEEAGMSMKTYSPAKAHSDEDLVKLAESAARLADITTPELLELFGAYIGPELLALHPRLIKPGWKTLEILANVEDTIHSVVRIKNPGASPPMLKTQRTGENEVQLVYSSPRHLCSVAKGMAKGLAAHFDENIDVEEDACMSEGDPFCSITFTKLPSDSISGDDAPDVAQFMDTGSINISQDQTVVIDTSVRPKQLDQDKMLGTYRVIDLLGNGGMGDVFRAEDPILERMVAIKTLRSELSQNQEMHDRFVREARNMGALHHEHIIPIFHIGYHESKPYIVMPLLPGKDLEHWKKSNSSPSLRSILRIGIETASALVAAHKENLIHRDVKPSNIWMEAPKGKVKLMDFGLSCSLDTAANITEPGRIIGTPAYMAPESLDGQYNERSDLYSLGVVLYELLTSVQPFQGSTLSGILSNIVNKNPDPIQTLVPDIPDSVNTIIMQLLDKDPLQRIPDAQQVAEQLLDIYTNTHT